MMYGRIGGRTNTPVDFRSTIQVNCTHICTSRMLNAYYLSRTVSICEFGTRFVYLLLPKWGADDTIFGSASQRMEKGEREKSVQIHRINNILRVARAI